MAERVPGAPELLLKGTGEFSIGSMLWTGTSKLLEETGELQQVLGKLIGSHGETEHYDGSDLRQRLIEEMGDVYAALSFFEGHNLTEVEVERVADRTRKKLVLFEKWHREGK